MTTSPGTGPIPATINRHIASQPPPAPPPGFWAQVLNTTVIAAAATAVLGGLLANLVVARFQDRARQREQALAAYRQHIEKQHEFILRLYDLVPAAITDAEAMIDLTSPHMDIQNASEGQRPELAKQRLELMARHNAAAETWNKERVRIGYLLAYYHPGATGVYDAWARCRTAVDTLRACSDAHYSKYRDDPRVTGSGTTCAKERDTAGKSLQDLTQFLNAARRYPWDSMAKP